MERGIGARRRSPSAAIAATRTTSVSLPSAATDARSGSTPSSGTSPSVSITGRRPSAPFVRTSPRRRAAATCHGSVRAQLASAACACMPPRRPAIRTSTRGSSSSCRRSTCAGPGRMRGQRTGTRSQHICERAIGLTPRDGGQGMNGLRCRSRRRHRLSDGGHQVPDDGSCHGPGRRLPPSRPPRAECPDRLEDGAGRQPARVRSVSATTGPSKPAASSGGESHQPGRPVRLRFEQADRDLSSVRGVIPAPRR